MKKIIFCILASILFVSCKKDPKNPPEDNIINLSSNGTANCYLITNPGVYSFDATVIGNGVSGIIGSNFHTNHPTISPESVKLIWQDYYENGEGFITELVLNENKTKVIFTTTKKSVSGNAVIAVCDADGKILWSWHIWKPAVEVTHLASTTGFNIMNINLGATTNQAGFATSYGMLYQWGRKDPFPNSSTLTGGPETTHTHLFNITGERVAIQSSSRTDLTNNNPLFAIQNPTICLSRDAHGAASHDWLATEYSNDALWGNPNGFERDTAFLYINMGIKSIYDPCPVGWRVPPVNAFRNFFKNSTVHSTISFNIADFNVKDLNGDGEITIADDYQYGWYFEVNEGVYSYFPSATRYDGQWAMLMGSKAGVWGTYWSNSPNDPASNVGRGLVPLSFGTEPIMLTIQANSGRADAYSVRCIKE